MRVYDANKVKIDTFDIQNCYMRCNRKISNVIINYKECDYDTIVHLIIIYYYCDPHDAD